MREDQKVALRAFAFISLLEVGLVLVVGTVAWTVAKHDLTTLNRSFYEGAWTERYCTIVAALMAVIVALNMIGVLIVAFVGGKSVQRAASAALVASGIIAALFFLPMYGTVLGLGGGIALFIVYKLLRLCWTGLSWPFKKIFRRAPKAP